MKIFLIAFLLAFSMAASLAQAASIVEKIQETIIEFRDFEVTVWDRNANLVTDDSVPPPYEIIVNTSPKNIRGCFDAKHSLHEVMKRLYTNPALKGKIARVKFTAWGQLRASLGSIDAAVTDWKAAGPSNFWKVLLKYKPYEDESGPLNQRTYGVKINNRCE